MTAAAPVAAIAHRVRATGVELAATERGDRAHPTVLLIHGYPDTQAAWQPVAALLSAAHHVITYDVRGAGASTAPSARAAYDLDRLADDTAAVLDALAPGRAVHVVGHDWGSMQAWHLAVSGRLGARLASITSTGAPCLDHVGHWLRGRLRAGALGDVVGQLARSWYIGLLVVPGVAPALWRRVGPRWPALLARLEHVVTDDGYPASTIIADGRHGARLYQQNVRRRLRDPHPTPQVDVPVLLLQVRRDRFVSPRLFDELERWAPRLQRVHLDAGHWLIRTHPDEVAAHVATWVDGIERARLAV